MGMEPLDDLGGAGAEGPSASLALRRLPLDAGRNNAERMPTVVSLADYLADRRRAAKVRQNEAIAHVRRLQELIDQSERRLIASDRQLRRTYQSLRSSGSDRKDGTPLSSR